MPTPGLPSEPLAEIKHEQLERLLIRAVEQQGMDLVCYLLEHGANVHAEADQAVRFAAKFGHTDEGIVTIIQRHPRFRLQHQILV